MVHDCWWNWWDEMVWLLRLLYETLRLLGLETIRLLVLKPASHVMRSLLGLLREMVWLLGLREPSVMERSLMEV